MSDQASCCIYCWRGRIEGGRCTYCHHEEEDPRKRQADTLPCGTLISGTMQDGTAFQDRYKVGAVLGKGGFGITYSAWDLEKRMGVALKELYPGRDVCRDADGVAVRVLEGQEGAFSAMVETFEKEAGLLMLLNQQGSIIHLYDLFYANGTVYYAMEYLDGSDLRNVLRRRGPMSWTELRPIARDVLRALGQLHKSNLIHRDISPDNLFLTKDQRVHLIDFGSVRAYLGTGSFTVFTKKNFSPWEQYITDGKQGPWTDIYAFSATMYMMLTGKLPPGATDRKIGGARLVPVRELCDVPPFVSEAIDKGMRMEWRDRFQTAEEYLRALKLQEMPEGGSSRPSKKPTAKPPGSGMPEGSPDGGSMPKARKAPAGSHAQAGGGSAAAAPKADPAWLMGESGIYKGKRLRLRSEQTLAFGRGQDAQVGFPQATGGVSRKQCVLYMNGQGKLYLKDSGSSYGTFLDGKRVGQDKWEPVMAGSRLRFGNEVFAFLPK